ncbi:putative membrane insertase OXA1/ALB3/YidC, membrane insertase YidC/Oxa1 [Medicago truncatula]|uniref:60 kDa inner membrane protein n=1 Tax=Medicago truncatula TaxID=3880 RepID=A0A072UZ26_MEDTR|nr:mitochondrial inner membrane protein OXA1 [Medicago truncatula]KEH31120.1 60 kDa inner membrane protein [Medicago truncatula]RHN62472.1 putative membrane insertase OXA1/ALB3/YidC, membrane insertase YidC/Oxa1 [Medicago truncatula]
MAYRRCLLQRGKLIDRRSHPSFTYLLHTDDETKPDEKRSSTGFSNNSTQSRSFRTSLNGGSIGFFSSSQHKHLSPFAGYNYCRNMSIMDQSSDKITVITDVADVTSQAATGVSEVAIAAADSYLPVQALQYVIDAVHLYTGLDWWAAIALTTLVIRTATVPLLVNQLKATSKLTLMRPRLEQIKEEMDGKTSDPAAVAQGQERMSKLFKEYGVTPFTPLKGLFIQGPVFISFFLAITNMAEKMPSFKHGGAFWFTDLTTPDALYIFPVLTALSFLIVVETNMQEGMEGNPMGNTMKKFSRVLALLSVPFTLSFPKAIFCYWITSNLFSLTYGMVLRTPGVKKTLGIPDLPPAEPTSSRQSPFSIFPALKQRKDQSSLPIESPKQIKNQSSLPVETPKQPNKKISSISQRIRSLEKHVKGRKISKK